ncbi:hypothetical protein FPV67DRAFT_1779537 [Lyophyllum atratum]|nr:hypothetical protein FPV67DRAFT_1779537 [Lyophyllum atratum]
MSEKSPSLLPPPLSEYSSPGFRETPDMGGRHDIKCFRSVGNWVVLEEIGIFSIYLHVFTLDVLDPVPRQSRRLSPFSGSRDRIPTGYGPRTCPALLLLTPTKALHVGTNRKALRSGGHWTMYSEVPESPGAGIESRRPHWRTGRLRKYWSTEAADCTGATEVLDCTEATELNDMEALERGTERKSEENLSRSRMRHGTSCEVWVADGHFVLMPADGED